MIRKSRPFEERLWEKIAKGDPNECWLWTATKAGKGYSTLRKFEDGKWKFVYAHREVLKQSKGEPIGDANQALHSCDTPACCNPAHLSWGNNSKNRREARDRLHNQGNQKLIPSQVTSIKEDQRIYREIAESYGVHVDTISRIKSGRAWLL